jgi:hypothetical protein
MIDVECRFFVLVSATICGQQAQHEYNGERRKCYTVVDESILTRQYGV